MFNRCDWLQPLIVDKTKSLSDCEVAVVDVFLVEWQASGALGVLQRVPTWSMF